MKSAQPNRAEPLNIHLKIANTWRELSAAIDKCTGDPDEKAVHHIRTCCRRMEAVISAILSSEMAQASHLQSPSASLLRKLRKIRRKAGKVRDLDIHLSLTESLRSKDHGSQSEDAGSKLHRALKRKRKLAAARLRKQIEHQRKKLDRHYQRFGKASQALPAVAHLDTAALSLSRFLEISASIPELHEDNLHEFRKQAKSARYIAEIDPRSPASRRVAKKLNQIQDAIGVWHDWHVMTGEAAEILHGKHTPLTGTIERKRRSAYRRAFSVARRTREQLFHTTLR